MSKSPSAGGGLFRFGLGPAIIFGAAWIIFWNEGGAAKTEARLKEGASSIIEISPDKVDPAQEGKLVHVVGEVKTEEKLTDPDLNVSLVAIALRREVEMYQWIEIEQRKDAPPAADGKPVPQIVTYAYSQEWRNNWVNSANFKEPAGHPNPPALLLKPASWQAEKVTLGAFELTSDQRKKLFANSPVKLTGDLGQAALAAGQGQLYRSEEYLLVRPDLAAVAKNKNQLSFAPATSPPQAIPSEVAASPQTGDVRIKFVAALPREVSVIGKQVGNQLPPYDAKAGGMIQSFLMGRHSAESVFQSGKAWSSRGTWFLRAVALAIIYIGVFITLGPITYYAASIAWLRPLVAGGMFYVRGGLTIAICAVLVGAAWFYYRPVYAIALFVVGALFLLGTIWLIVRFSRGSRPPGQ